LIRKVRAMSSNTSAKGPGAALTDRVLVDLLRERVVRQMSAWLAELPPEIRREPLFGSAAGEDGEPLSPEGILDHIKRATDLGNKLLLEAAGLNAVSNLGVGALGD
jgi:hypothetical protein